MDEADACFQTFQSSFGLLVPKLPKEGALHLLAAVRSLWVHPGAAAYLARALERKGSLALAAQLILQADPALGAEVYTLERYIERAWPGAPVLKRVRGLTSSTPDEVRARISDATVPPGVPSILDDA